MATYQNGIKEKVVFGDLFLPSNDSLPDDIKTEHIDYLKSVAKVTDIWKDGLSEVFTALTKRAFPVDEMRGNVIDFLLYFLGGQYE